MSEWSEGHVHIISYACDNPYGVFPYSTSIRRKLWQFIWKIFFRCRRSGIKLVDIGTVSNQTRDSSNIFSPELNTHERSNRDKLILYTSNELHIPRNFYDTTQKTA